MWIYWVSAFVQAVICGIASSFIAEKKGYSKSTWLLVGFFLSLFGLIITLALPDLYARSLSPPPAIYTTRTCPNCAESIKAGARACRYCGYQFNLEDEVNDAIQSLRSGDAQLRASAIDVLCNFGDERVAGYLVDALVFCPTELRETVVDKLLSFREKSAVPALVDTIRWASGKGRSGERIVASCAEALADLADASIGHDLAGLLSLNVRTGTKKYIIRLLGSVRATEHIPAIIKIASDAELLRPQALEAIKGMGSSAVKPLKEMLDTATRRHKWIIMELLRELDSNPPNSASI